MDSIEIKGGQPLHGTIEIAGAKNACLALMPASLLTDQPLTLTNAPRLADITTMTQLLRSLGVEVRSMKSGQVLSMSGHDINEFRADYDIVRKMRASILALGPLLARLGRARVSLPGGCAIGARPVNIHLDALSQLGAEIVLEDGYINATLKSSSLQGAVIELPMVSVGATENTLLAASLAKGTTVIGNAAREPEIVDLANCLREMGAKIEGDGTGRIEIEGSDSLNGATHKVIPDRIETGTYMLATAIAGGEVTLQNAQVNHLGNFVEKLMEAGVEIGASSENIRVQRKPTVRLASVDVVTEPYPGFPTDLQAQMMAAMSIAAGQSRLEEKIFENRFMHAPELMRMGAKIEIHGGTAFIDGVESLLGAPVMATDLRASVSLILAGLAAKGQTRVSRVYHLDRGYERVEEKLKDCGAIIRRIKS